MRWDFNFFFLIFLRLCFIRSTPEWIFPCYGRVPAHTWIFTCLNSNRWCDPTVTVNQISKAWTKANRPFYLRTGRFKLSRVERQSSLSPSHTPMGCHAASWLCAPTPTATTTTGSSKFYKSTTIFCCINSPADSTHPLPSESTGSSSRRWYNPLKKRPLDQPPEIVRHWIDSDHPFPSQGIFGCCLREI